eukprot:1862188-Pyramimonas_sp.AAC.1
MIRIPAHTYHSGLAHNVTQERGGGHEGEGKGEVHAQAYTRQPPSVARFSLGKPKNRKTLEKTWVSPALPVLHAKAMTFTCWPPAGSCPACPELAHED